MERQDIAVAGNPPDALRSAFEVVSHLHRAFDKHSNAIKASSLTSCILCAEIAAIAFRKMGLNAQSVPSALLKVTFAPNTNQQKYIVHKIGSTDNHSLHDNKTGERLDGWNGHMVTIVEDYLFDPTFWQVDKDVPLPVMLALPIKRQRVLNDRYDGLAHTRANLGGVGCEIVYVDTPTNTDHLRYWNGSRAQRKVIEHIRDDVANALYASRAINRPIQHIRSQG